MNVLVALETLFRMATLEDWYWYLNVECVVCKQISFYKQIMCFYYKSCSLQITCFYKQSESWLITVRSDVFYINFYGCNIYDAGLYVTDPSKLGPGMVLCDAPLATPLLSVLFFFLFIVVSSLVLLSMFVGAITISMSECVELINEESR
jgi:hypothetical protein